MLLKCDSLFFLPPNLLLTWGVLLVTLFENTQAGRKTSRKGKIWLFLLNSNCLQYRVNICLFQITNQHFSSFMLYSDVRRKRRIEIKIYATALSKNWKTLIILKSCLDEKAKKISNIQTILSVLCFWLLLI